MTDCRRTSPRSFIDGEARSEGTARVAPAAEGACATPADSALFAMACGGGSTWLIEPARAAQAARLPGRRKRTLSASNCTSASMTCVRNHATASAVGMPASRRSRSELASSSLRSMSARSTCAQVQG